MRSADLRRASFRVRIVGFAIVLGFLLLGARAAHLSLVDERGHDLGPRQAKTVLRLAPARGAITDRSGAELAMTVPAPSVYAVPKQVSDPRAAARALAPILGMSPGFLEARLGLGGMGRHTPPGMRRAAISRGSRRIPPFASAAVAAASCIAVTLTPWPKDTVAWSTGRQRFQLRRRPGDSSGKPLPVRAPKPSAVSMP